MKKILRSFVILLMMLLTITGCHKSDDQSHNTSTTKNDTNTNNTSSNTLSQDNVLQIVMKQVSGLKKEIFILNKNMMMENLFMKEQQSMIKLNMNLK